MKLIKHKIVSLHGGFLTNAMYHSIKLVKFTILNYRKALWKKGLLGHNVQKIEIKKSKLGKHTV